MRTVGPRLAAGLIAAGLVLAGCGGSAEPKSLPAPTKSPSPSASPSAAPTAPVLPEAAKAKTKAGAEAFVRHYVQVLNYATFTGKTDAARALDDGKCSSCQRMLASIDAIYTKGGNVKGGAWTPTLVSDVPHPGGNGWTVDAKITYGPQTVVRATNAQPEKYTGGGRLVSFILETSRDGGWQVREWTRAS
jgi:hypothetical protein